MNPQEQEALQELRNYIIGQKTASLPDMAEDDSLVALHDQMLDYDAFVSQLVISTLQGNLLDCQYGNLAGINQALEQASQDTPSHLVRAVRKYRMYKERLDAMYALACQISQLRSQAAEGPKP